MHRVRSGVHYRIVFRQAPVRFRRGAPLRDDRGAESSQMEPAERHTLAQGVQNAISAGAYARRIDAEPVVLSTTLNFLGFILSVCLLLEMASPILRWLIRRAATKPRAPYSRTQGGAAIHDWHWLIR